MRAFAFCLLIISITAGVVSFQNCGFKPLNIQTDSSQVGSVSNASLMLLSSEALPKIDGFVPGPVNQEPYFCGLENEIIDIPFAGAVTNQIRMNQQPIWRGSELQVELTSVLNDRIRREMLTLNQDYSFRMEVPFINSVIYYYLQVRDPQRRVLCTTKAAAIRNKPPICTLSIANSQIYPNQSASFLVRHDLGNYESRLQGSWVTSHNGTNIESGIAATPMANLNTQYNPGARRGNFLRSLIIRDTQSNSEVCRTNEVAFRALTNEEAQRNLSDISSGSRDQSSSIGIPTNPTGSGGSPTGDSRTVEDREWCQEARSSFNCQVTRTYCSGSPGMQTAVTDEVPVTQRVEVIIPRRQRATVLQNYVEFVNRGYSIVTLRVNHFCNPDTNPQWQFFDVGFRCELRLDQRPTQGCDSSRLPQL